MNISVFPPERARDRASVDAARLSAAIVNSSSDAIISKTLTGVVTSWNPAATRIFGYSAAEMIGQSIFRLVPENRRAEEEEILKKLRRGELVNHFETVRRRKDGGEAVISATISPILDDSNKVIGASKIARDISDAKLTRDILANFIHHAPGLLAYWDKNLICRFANQGYLSWFGKTAEQMVGLGMRQVLGERLFALNESSIMGALSGVPQSFNRELVKTDGTITQTLARYWPDFDENGDVRGFSVLVSDVTELKTAEQNLAKANMELLAERNRAEAANHAKSKFLADVSHEFRSPLGAITGFAELLLTDAGNTLSDKHKRWISQIGRAGEHLLNVIGEVVDVAKIEAGILSFDITSANVAALVEECVCLTASVFPKYGVTVHNDVRDREIAIRCDLTRAKQVIVNLLTNAAKYNRPGGFARIHEAPTHDGFHRVTVTDDGRGIPVELHAKVFREFNRLSPDAAEIEGSGMGLKISKTLIEAMGGRIGFSSALSEGSSFWLDFPKADGIGAATSLDSVAG